MILGGSWPKVPLIEEGVWEGGEGGHFSKVLLINQKTCEKDCGS